MIYYECPACHSRRQAPDHQAGIKLFCGDCGQRLQVPAPLPNKTVLARPTRKPRPAYAPAGPLPGWLWRPRRLRPPENSGDTFWRVALNLLCCWIMLKVTVAALTLISVLIFMALAGALWTTARPLSP